MKSPNNVGDNALTRHLLSPNEASSSRNGLHLSCWPKGPHRHHQTTQAMAKVMVFFPQTVGKVLLLKTAPVQFTGHREVKQATWTPSTERASDTTSVPNQKLFPKENPHKGKVPSSNRISLGVQTIYSGRFHAQQ